MSSVGAIARATPERLRSGAQALLHRGGLPTLAWRIGLGEERRFWDHYLASGGSAWPEEYAERLAPDRPVNEALLGLVAAAPADPVTVLDVGSGPLTWVGSGGTGRQVEITAVDPLASWYSVLFERHGIVPSVRPTTARAERLREVFPDGRFDVVVARNALDHGIDPRRGMTEMLAVTRPGGFVYLEHAEREGRNQRYRGLHQWDFSVEAGQLRLGHRAADVDLSSVLAEVSSVRAETGPDRWVRVWLHKHESDERP